MTAKVKTHGRPDMPAALRFMFAARRCELRSLEGLGLTSELVERISRLVHALQKERGYSNMHIGSSCDSEHLLSQLNALSEESNTFEAEVRSSLDRLEPDADHPADRTRLFNRIAHLLYGLEELPGLRRRRRIRDRSIGQAESTTAFTRLIGGLLAVVFEAADTALDPQVTRALAALFNFMQGKELSGQERACGVIGFTAGYLDDAQREQMRQLIESQQRCFELFAQHAHDQALRSWESIAADEAPIRQLRDIALRTSPDQRVDTGLAELWFDVMTARIDAMRQVESLLAQALVQRSQERIVQTRADMANHRTLVRQLGSAPATETPPMLFNVQGSSMDAPPADGVGGHLGRSILELVQEQTLRLQRLGDELQEARSALDEYKYVDQAKRALMRLYGLSEQTAYRHMQRAAMDSGRRVVDIAKEIVALPLGGAGHSAADREGRINPGRQD